MGVGRGLWVSQSASIRADGPTTVNAWKEGRKELIFQGGVDGTCGQRSNRRFRIIVLGL